MHRAAAAVSVESGPLSPDDRGVISYFKHVSDVCNGEYYVWKMHWAFLCAREATNLPNKYYRSDRFWAPWQVKQDCQLSERASIVNVCPDLAFIPYI